MSAWLQAIRPKTLPAGAAPVAVGTSVAAGLGSVRPLPAAAALAGALLLQIGSNLSNDYFDHEHGADTGDRVGPVRVTAGGLISPTSVRRAYRLTFALAALVGVYLVVIGGWPIVVIGLASILCAWAYTGGPRLGYLGLGDPLVFVFFGPVAVCGTCFVQTGRWEPIALLASIPVGLLTTAILVVNNYRDTDTDRVAGKRTLAVRLGRSLTRGYYGALLVGAFLVVGALATQRSPWALLPLAALPLAIGPLRAVLASTPDGPQLNAALGQTARLLLVFSLLLCPALAGWL